MVTPQPNPIILNIWWQFFYGLCEIRVNVCCDSWQKRRNLIACLFARAISIGKVGVWGVWYWRLQFLDNSRMISVVIKRLTLGPGGLLKKNPHLGLKSQILDSSAQILDSSAQIYDSSAQSLNSSAQFLETSAQNLDSSTQILGSSAKIYGSSAQNLDSSAQILVSTARIVESSARYWTQVPESWTLVPESWSLVPKSWAEVPDSWAYKYPNRGLKSPNILTQVSKSWTQVPKSWTQVTKSWAWSCVLGIWVGARWLRERPPESRRPVSQESPRAKLHAHNEKKNFRKALEIFFYFSSL